MPREFDIATLGPRRAGKTSLLASVSQQFQNVVSGLDLEVAPIGGADRTLSTFISCLEQTFDTQSRLPKNNGEMVPPTEVSGTQETTVQYRFDLGLPDKEAAARLIFHDFPGWQLIDKRYDVIQRVRRCVVTVIAVDTPALMVERSRECSWVFHNERNVPYAINTGSAGMYELFREAYHDLDEDRLVILAPIKCEKWVQDSQSAAAMLTRLQKGYEQLLKLLASDHLKHRVAVVVSPVQTLGNIEYAYMDREDSYSARYLKKSIHSKYEPHDSERLLRYILRFVLGTYLRKPDLRNRLLFALFKKDAPYRRAIKAFAAAESEAGDRATGFAILQGKHLL